MVQSYPNAQTAPPSEQPTPFGTNLRPSDSSTSGHFMLHAYSWWFDSHDDALRSIGCAPDRLHRNQHSAKLQIATVSIHGVGPHSAALFCDRSAENGAGEFGAGFKFQRRWFRPALRFPGFRCRIVWYKLFLSLRADRFRECVD